MIVLIFLAEFKMKTFSVDIRKLGDFQKEEQGAIEAQDEPLIKCLVYSVSTRRHDDHLTVYSLNKKQETPKTKGPSVK